MQYRLRRTRWRISLGFGDGVPRFNARSIVRRVYRLLYRCDPAQGRGRSSFQRKPQVA